MIVVTAHSYALGRTWGIARAMRMIEQEIANPNENSPPFCRAIARLRTITDVKLSVDTGAASIGKARTRAFYDALNSDDCDGWITIDDDCEATVDTLRALVQRISQPLATLTLVPCWLRDVPGKPRTVNVCFKNQLAKPESFASGQFLECDWGGFGIAGMSRYAMQSVESNTVDDYVQFDDGKSRKPVFSELTQFPDGDRLLWLGEDRSFCERCHYCGVRVEALITGVSKHNDLALRLEDVGSLAAFAPQNSHDNDSG